MSFLAFAAENALSPCFFELLLQFLPLSLSFGETFAISTWEARRLCEEGSIFIFKACKWQIKFISVSHRLLEPTDPVGKRCPMAGNWEL